MDRAAMPKAAVNEYGKLRLGKQISIFRPRIWGTGNLEPVAGARSMQQSPQLDFGCCVLPALAFHSSRGSR